jgi:hypothetical protein
VEEGTGAIDAANNDVIQGGMSQVLLQFGDVALYVLQISFCDPPPLDHLLIEVAELKHLEIVNTFAGGGGAQ